MMSEPTAQAAAKRKLHMPDTWLVVFAIVAVMAALSWVIPSGSFDYQKVDVNGTMRSVAVAGSYHAIPKAQTKPTGFIGLFASLYQGCYEAADIIFVILTCAATFGVMVKTGAFHAGIGKVMKKVGRREKLLIPILMVLFGLGGSVFGMLSEFYGFYPLIVGLGVTIGYDAMTGFAILALGEYVGFMAATLNPYSVAVAQSIAGVPLYSGVVYRAICFAVFMGLCIAYVMRYAAKVKRSPQSSVMYGEPCLHSFDRGELDQYRFTWRHGLILLDALVTLAVLMIGLTQWGWGYKELCGLFIVMSAAAALISGWNPNRYCAEMLTGAKGVLWGCILTGLAKSIVVIMKDAQIMDTIINALANLLKNAPSAISAQLMFVVQTVINFLVPSASGQAAVTMPIMAPLADALGVSRQVACLAYQFGDGLSNILWPTCGIVVICGLADIHYDLWLKWFAKLFAMLFLAQMIMIEIAVLMGW